MVKDNVEGNVLSLEGTCGRWVCLGGFEALRKICMRQCGEAGHFRGEVMKV